MGIGQASNWGRVFFPPALTQNAGHLFKSEMPLAWNIRACVGMQRSQEQKRRAACWQLVLWLFVILLYEGLMEVSAALGVEATWVEGGACKPAPED